jgi:hypothetical protein
MKKKIIVIVLFTMTLVTFGNYPKDKEVAKEITEIIQLTDTIFTPSIFEDTGYVSEEWLRYELANQGVTGDNINRFVYIAKRESSLNPNAHNTTLNKNRTTDHGLFQINSVHKELHAKYNLFDPFENLLAAIELYQNHGFAPWFTLKEREHFRKGIYDARKWRNYIPN